jgi:cytoskeletal protein CcmA (bactofilin family)
LVASLLSAGTVRLNRTARFFGDIQAANLIVEAGAVFVGSARIGLPPEPPPAPEPVKAVASEPKPVAATRRTRPVRTRKQQ